MELSDYDLVNDDTWQTLNIPISDFIEANPNFFKLSQVSQYFMIAGEENVPADFTFNFDEIFWVSH